MSEESSFAGNLSMQAQVDSSPPRFDFRQMQLQIEAQQRQYALQNTDNDNSHGTQHMRDQWPFIFARFQFKRPYQSAVS